MKPFNLEEALAGKPVQLRDGSKAFITSDYKQFFPYNIYRFQGVFLIGKSETQYQRNQWTEDGASLFEYEKYIVDTNPYDIIGMWEEPTPTVTLTLPKPFQPKKGEEYYFIRQNGFGSLYVDKKTRESIAFEYNAFRKEEDAQAWIDAMRDAVYE